MNVFKFGGASIVSAELAKNSVSIIQKHSEDKLLVVISAKGKTTNALEEIVNEYYKGNSAQAQQLFWELEVEHQEYALKLIGTIPEDLATALEALFLEIEWILNEEPVRSYDYYYDQVVCIGELLSTLIISAYINRHEKVCVWIDIRDVIKTDANYRDAGILWEQTRTNILEKIVPLFSGYDIIITQGFIGSTDENNSVTLGREGSDYTAAVLANCCDAGSVTIWKDVKSLLNADPKIFPNTVPIEEITFHEVIEMAYYGAQVIHPKTIKPLQNKNIPLYVKCFLEPEGQGTLIHDSDKKIKYPPILVLKTNQVLLQVTTKDYSFITELNLSKIYNMFYESKIRINLIQNAAISFVACVDAHANHLDDLLAMLKEEYEVKRNEDLFLFTVRHYRQDILNEELRNRTVLLTQKTRQTIQMVVK